MSRKNDEKNAARGIESFAPRTSEFLSYSGSFINPCRRDLPVSMQAMFLVGASSWSQCGSYRDKDVPPTGRHQAHLCSSGAPAPERVRSRCSCPTGVTRSDSKTDGEGQALALRGGKRFFHRSAEACLSPCCAIYEHPLNEFLSYCFLRRMA